MKNVFGKQKELKLYNSKGDLVYEFYKNDDYYWEYTYDDQGNQLTYENSNGYRCEYTYDDQGNQLTYKSSEGNWSELTYDDKGNALTYKDSNGFWCESTYDDLGNELTYKSSEGVSKTFDIPEYTMEELTKIVGKEFKIKK